MADKLTLKQERFAWEYTRNGGNASQAYRDVYACNGSSADTIAKRAHELRHVADYFDLQQPERNAIEQLLHECQQKLRALDASINGFNIGANAGQSAGQTVCR